MPSVEEGYVRASSGQEDDFLLSQGPWVILWRKEGNEETFDLSI